MIDILAAKPLLEHVIVMRSAEVMLFRDTGYNKEKTMYRGTGQAARIDFS